RPLLGAPHARFRRQRTCGLKGYVREVPQAVMPPSARWRRCCSLTFEPPQRDVPKSPFFGGRLMPSAGIPLRPSFVRSSHVRIARALFPACNKNDQGGEAQMKLRRRTFLHLPAGPAALPPV